ncbi:hypothetical protein RRG08_015102 [Elysia crispata]|uniref:Ig-like domain-containing protein n=1 Tax=Elysia crispata TaxID=231223 RepID=A0AAE1EBQ8_9GAST|nr:hypothetical protein RRG08_015102 [Elysia crispata]
MPAVALILLAVGLSGSAHAATPEYPECRATLNRAHGVESSVTVSCWTTKVYPEAECRFQWLQEGSLWLEVKQNPTYNHTRINETSVYSHCSVTVPVAEMGSGPYTFRVFIYPRGKSGESFVDVITVTVPVPDTSNSNSINLLAIIIGAIAVVVVFVLIVIIIVILRRRRYQKMKKNLSGRSSTKVATNETPSFSPGYGEYITIPDEAVTAGFTSAQSMSNTTPASSMNNSTSEARSKKNFYTSPSGQKPPNGFKIEEKKQNNFTLDEDPDSDDDSIKMSRVVTLSQNHVEQGRRNNAFEHHEAGLVFPGQNSKTSNSGINNSRQVGKKTSVHTISSGQSNERTGAPMMLPTYEHPPSARAPSIPPKQNKANLKGFMALSLQDLRSDNVDLGYSQHHRPLAGLKPSNPANQERKITGAEAMFAHKEKKQNNFTLDEDPDSDDDYIKMSRVVTLGQDHVEQGRRNNAFEHHEAGLVFPRQNSKTSNSGINNSRQVGKKTSVHTISSGQSNERTSAPMMLPTYEHPPSARAPSIPPKQNKANLKGFMALSLQDLRSNNVDLGYSQHHRPLAGLKPSNPANQERKNTGAGAMFAHSKQRTANPNKLFVPENYLNVEKPPGVLTMDKLEEKKQNNFTLDEDPDSDDVYIKMSRVVTLGQDHVEQGRRNNAFEHHEAGLVFPGQNSKTPNSGINNSRQVGKKTSVHTISSGQSNERTSAPMMLPTYDYPPSARAPSIPPKQNKANLKGFMALSLQDLRSNNVDLGYSQHHRPLAGLKPSNPANQERKNTGAGAMFAHSKQRTANPNKLFVPENYLNVEKPPGVLTTDKLGTMKHSYQNIAML